MKQRLQELLEELHAELESPEAMDEQSREALQGLAGEIEAAVGEDTAGSANGGLQQSVLEFETEHPRIAGILGQIADTLAKLGI